MATKTTLKPNRIEQLPIGQLVPDSDQPRRSIDDAALAALADNIKARGVIQPILVRAVNKVFVIVDGERRWRAAKLARLKVVPAMLHVAGTTEVELRVDQVAANNLRQALSPMDFARFLRRLRDEQKLPVSGIAAALEKHGMQAMKKQEIETQLLLTELPDWAQEMVDGKTLDLAAAPVIRRATQDPKIAPAVRKSLEQKVTWSGRVTTNEAREAFRNAMRDTYVNLDHTGSWYSDAVCFDHKTRCKGCEHYATGDGLAVCKSKKLFAEHQAEAKAAGLGPGGKKPEPQHLAAARQEKAKVEQREQSIERTASEYLLRYILWQLDEVLERDLDLCYSLVLWAAAWRPAGGYQCDRQQARVREMFGDERLEEHRARWSSLSDFLIPIGALPRTPHELNRTAAVRLIARQIKDCLDLTHMILLARHVWGEDLAAFWKMDAAFPKLFRKAELVHQLKACGAELPEGRKSWDAMKITDLRAALLENAAKVGVPQLLRDLYAAELRPAARRQIGATTCIGCGCTYEDACEGGCSWVAVDHDDGIGVCSSCQDEHLARFEAGERELSPEAEARMAERDEHWDDDADDSVDAPVPDDDEDEAA